jgi:aspartate-semialdehyde dehydrogenase
VWPDFTEMKLPHVAIVGATGAVGVEMLLCLEQRNFPLSKLTLLASARSAGKTMKFRGEDITIKELTHDCFEGIDIALFSAGGGISLEFAPSAAAAGAVVIDNSSAFRMDEGVPLVVPEINPAAAKNRPKGIIANPNCTTIISLMALAPLHEKFELTSIIASSYQAVSGSGAQGIIELEEQIQAIANGKEFTPKVYPRQIAFNVIPQVDSFTENGYTKEEMKMLNEGRKILEHSTLKVSCTCVRVPVYRSHSVSITAQFTKEPSVEAARAAYAGKPGICVVDDPTNKVFPVPLDTTGKDDCLVGRIRKSIVLENALDLWVVGDQVRKGAALNAVQIAEIL